LRRAQFRERGRLVTTDHDRFQGEGSHAFCSPGASAGERRCVHEPSERPPPRRATHHAERAAMWLTYTEAASYAGWSVGHLRNLVYSGRIPVYGRPRVRRFRRDMLDLHLTNPNMAMREFRSERNELHGR
jgi:excisionase family DNA binding protein